MDSTHKECRIEQFDDFLPPVVVVVVTVVVVVSVAIFNKITAFPPLENKLGEDSTCRHRGRGCGRRGYKVLFKQE